MANERDLLEIVLNIIAEVADFTGCCSFLPGRSPKGGNDIDANRRDIKLYDLCPEKSKSATFKLRKPRPDFPSVPTAR